MITIKRLPSSGDKKVRQEMDGPRSLVAVEPPWVLRADLASEGVRASIVEAGQVGIVVELDGAAVRTRDSFLAALSTALSFPHYFGKNWDALQDCLTDLEWLTANSYVLIFRSADQLFADAPIERRYFLQIMNLVAEEWAVPVALGEWWDRPAIPFHVILDSGVSAWSSELLQKIGSLE